jgi:hypothetical protein
MGEPDEDDLPTGAEALKAKQQFEGEPVRIPLDVHPEGELVLPEGRVEFIREEYGVPIEDYLYEGYIRWRISTEQAVRFVTTSDDSVAERRLDVLEALVDNTIPNSASVIADTIGADRDAVRRDLQRLAELVDEADYEDGDFVMPDSDRLWAFVVEARSQLQK